MVDIQSGDVHGDSRMVFCDELFHVYPGKPFNASMQEYETGMAAPIQLAVRDEGIVCVVRRKEADRWCDALAEV